MKRMISLCVFLLMAEFLGISQQFKTVKIGNMIWMAENLNISTPSGSWWYNDKPELGSKYGRLYTWEVAKNVCPAGWHLPSEAEWTRLIEIAGGSNEAGRLLKAGGALGFNATYAGFANIGNFMLLESYGAYWSATSYDKDHAWYVYLTKKDNLATKTYFTKSYGLSVRCVKN